MGNDISNVLKEDVETVVSAIKKNKLSIQAFISKRNLFVVTGGFMFAHVMNNLVDALGNLTVGNLLDKMLGINHKDMPSNWKSEIIEFISALLKAILIFFVVYAFYVFSESQNLK